MTLKYRRTHDHMLAALAAVKAGDMNKAGRQLILAAAEPDAEDAIEELNDAMEEAQDAEDGDEDAGDPEIEAAKKKACASVRTMSTSARARLLVKASVDEDDADEVDLEDESDVVDAIVGEEDDPEAVARTLASLGLIAKRKKPLTQRRKAQAAADDEDWDDDEDDQDEEDEGSEDEQALASSLKANVRRVKLNMKGVLR